MQREYQWNLTTDRSRVTGTMKHIKIQLIDSPWQRKLFPERIEVASNLYDMHIFAILKTTVVTWCHKNEILISGIRLLQLFDFLKNHIIHSVLVCPENALCFNTYPHICLITFAGTPATSEWGGTSFVTTAPAATML